MLFFAAAAVNTQPDYIALAMVLALALVVLVMALRKRAALKAPKAEAAPAKPAVQAEKSTAPGSAGTLKLHDVEPKTAAMLMAIVADKLGKPLNELRFISIKEVK
jgi:3-oxoacyl-ACP reductase-like protein